MKMMNDNKMTGLGLIAEAREKHREVKKNILRLMERANIESFTKENINRELFKIYLELK